MEYEQVKEALDQAWIEFYHALNHAGFTDEQINKLDRQLNMKDCFNDVEDCVMECAR